MPHGGYRAFDPATFFASQAQLSQTWGMINTLILLASSWMVARCVLAARERRFDEATRFAWATIAAGVVFAAGGATTIWVDFPQQKSVTLPDWVKALVTP